MAAVDPLPEPLQLPRVAIENPSLEIQAAESSQSGLVSVPTVAIPDDVVTVQKPTSTKTNSTYKGLPSPTKVQLAYTVHAKSVVNHRTKRLATHSTTVKRTAPMKKVRSPKASGGSKKRKKERPRKVRTCKYSMIQCK